MECSDRVTGIFLDRAARLKEMKKLANIASDWLELRCIRNMWTFKVKHPDQLRVSNKIKAYFRSLIDADRQRHSARGGAAMSLKLENRPTTPVMSAKEDAEKHEPKDKLLKLGGLIKQLR